MRSGMRSSEWGMRSSECGVGSAEQFCNSVPGALRFRMLTNAMLQFGPRALP
jgi:hypothetical protein